MSAPYLGGDLIVEFLERLGVDTAFGITSVHNIPILDAIGRGNAIRFVMSRGEMGAGHMADAYARVTGKLGVLITSTGPGAANAVPALMEARAAWTPMLHITGQTATKFAGRRMGTVHDVPDQLGMLRATCKSAYHVDGAANLLDILAAAATDALSTPCGPVSVEVPIDVQRTVVTRPAELDDLAISVPQPPAPCAADIDALIAAVLKARRPMIWLGSGARAAREPAMQLLDLGFRAVSSWAGRGIIPETDERSLGTLSGLGTPLVEKFYRTVDLMVVVGSRLRGQETFDFAVNLPANLMLIDIDPEARDRTYPLQGFVCGDSALTLEALVKAAGPQISIDPGFAAEFATLRATVQRDYRASLGPYASFPEQIRAAMPPDSIWVRDATIAGSSWGHRLMPVLEPSESVYPVCAAIGPGLPFGIGGAVAGTGVRKTVVLTGDGGFALNMTELWTVVHEKLDVAIIVMNDSGYGVIKQIQDAMYGGRHYFTDPALPPLEDIAAIASIPFWKVDKATGLGAALRQALALAGPAMIEVDVAAIGAIPPYYPYNVPPQPEAGGPRSPRR